MWNKAMNFGTHPFLNPAGIWPRLFRKEKPMVLLIMT